MLSPLRTKLKLFTVILTLFFSALVTADDGYKVWVSGALSPGYDFVQADDQPGIYAQGKLNLSKGDFTYSFRAFSFKKRYGRTRCLFKNCNDKHDYILDERSFLIGREFFDDQLTLAAGLGQLEAEYNLVGKDDFSELSIPLELTFTPIQSSVVGLDLGISANLNKEIILYAFTVGMRLGWL